MRLAAVTVCKNRLSDLERTLPLLAQAGFDEVVLVDYACPQHCGDWAQSAVPTATVVREPEADGFNVSRARNLGASVCSADWIFFVDADVLVQPDLVAFLREEARSGCFYRSQRVPGQRVTAWGSVVVERAAFSRVGGYDEVYVGWGCEDDDLFYKLAINGLRERHFPVSVIAEIITSESDRLRYSPVGNRSIQHVLNLMYLQAKKQIWASGYDMSELPLAIRQALYAAIRAHAGKVSRLLDDPGSSHSVKLKLPGRAMAVIRPLTGIQNTSIEFALCAAPRANKAVPSRLVAEES